MNSLKITLGIFLFLAVSRFIPHPPNFTSLIALSFYAPAIFGLRSIPIVLFSFAITDIFFGFHNTLLFTWGSVVLIGLISKYFYNSFFKRLSGALLGAICFFIITNFGVWVSGLYSYDINGLFTSYIMGLPFFGYTLISTLIFSLIIETVYKFFFLKFKI